MLVSRKAINFCIYNLYPEALLWLLISSRRYFWSILSDFLHWQLCQLWTKFYFFLLKDFLHRRSCHLWTKTVLFFPSQYIYFYFLFLSYCISLEFQYNAEKEECERTSLPCSLLIIFYYIYKYRRGTFEYYVFTQEKMKKFNVTLQQIYNLICYSRDLLTFSSFLLLLFKMKQTKQFKSGPASFNMK